jgi:uncharacterized protein
MLTRAQIQRLAQRHGIGAQAQERDYIQVLLLYLLYSRTQAMIFKGGTALRLVYRGNRYSEDLDFNAMPDLPSNQLSWQKTVDALHSYGITASIRQEWVSQASYSFDVSYQGPLYDGRDRSKGKIRIDLNLRQEAAQSQRVLLNPEYDDLPPFVLTALAPEYLLAEKIRALLVRGKPRDVYDIWLLLQKGVPADLELIASRLALYNLPLTRQGLLDALETACASWERDLKALLPQWISWDVVSPDLAAWVRSTIPDDEMA